MKTSWVYLLLLCAWFVIAGTLKQMLYVESDADLIAEAFLALPYPVLMRLWLWAHSSERRIQLPGGTAILVPLLTVVGVPYYLFRSRPTRNALRQIPVSLLAMVIASYAYWAGESLAYALQTAHR